jgi:hypothetical protein
MLDIWQFYRSERLYLLQITKEMLSSSLMTEEDSGDSEVAMSTLAPRILFLFDLIYNETFYFVSDNSHERMQIIFYFLVLESM